MMDGEALAQAVHALWLIWLAMLLVGVALYVGWPGNRRRFDEAADLALDGDIKGALSERTGESGSNGR